jgi:hypothetical protein
MTQSGELLNPPIDTPAPGTGAIDARVSPDGRYVAYWFVTTVNDPLCPFCVDTTNRALISRSDSFTNATDIGTPNTGGWPSWDGNATLVLTNGSGTVWYYTIGMPEAAMWFDNSVFGDGQFWTLLDGEVSHDRTRFALVRGDNQEFLVTFAMAGAIPATPTPVCAFSGPTGKFVNPTWSQDGLTLAWKEDDGIWQSSIPNVSNCASYGMPHLVIPGGADPDFSPASVNPGARPGCGNPGGPPGCASTTSTTLPGCVAVATYESIGCRLDALIASVAAAQDLGRLKGALLSAGRSARTKERRAEDLVATGKTKRQRNAMKQAVHALTTFLRKSGSHVAQKLIPAATRQGLFDQATAILADMNTLLGTL